MKAFKYTGCLSAFLLWSLSLTAQTVPAALDNLLQHTLDSMRQATGARSLSAAIQFSDGAVWAHADGISSVQPTVHVTSEDAYLIGSVTKTLTSACVLQLADEGLLHLDDSLHTWLDTMPYINPDITIRQLLQHTSGLFDVLAHPHNQDSMMADMSRIWTPEELIERFMAPPLFQPGAAWSYCNTNYFLLSMIIRNATGNPFYTEIRNRFFTPLNLQSFAIPAFETLNAPVAHLWMDLNGDNVQEDANDFYMNYMALNSTAGAAGGYFATPSDCSRWMRTYMRGDLLTPATLAAARTTVNAPGSQGNLYGLGMMKNQSDFLGYLAYGHGGDLAYHASSWYFPEKDASITVFTNDNSVTSWALLPVVRELLRTYVNDASTAIAQQQQASAAIHTYPNPFQDQLRVDLCLESSPAGELQVELKDMLGKTIARRTGRHLPGQVFSVSFEDLDSLPGGIYFVTLHDGDRWSKTLKVTKAA